MASRYPASTSRYASEGTTAHALAERVFRERRPASEYVGCVLVPDEYGVAVDAEMAEAVQAYVDRVLAEVGTSGWLAVESRLDISPFVGVPNQYGTADAIVVRPQQGEVQVHDLKYGKGVAVNAKDNAQLLLYGLAAHHLVSVIEGPLGVIRTVIHQPRLGHQSEHCYSVADLAERKRRFRDGGKLAAALVQRYGGAVARGDIPAAFRRHLVPGEEQCRWCPARAGGCPALNEIATQAVSQCFPDLDNPQAVLPDDPKELRRLYDLVPLLKVLYRAIEARVGAEMLAGRPMEGLKLVRGRRGIRRWTDESAVERILGELGVPTAKTHELRPPAQVERAVGTPTYRAHLAALVSQSDGKLVIVREDDPREPVTVEPTAVKFEDLESEG